MLSLLCLVDLLQSYEIFKLSLNFKFKCRACVHPCHLRSRLAAEVDPLGPGMPADGACTARSAAPMESWMEYSGSTGRGGPLLLSKFFPLAVVRPPPLAAEPRLTGPSPAPPNSCRAGVAAAEAGRELPPPIPDDRMDAAVGIRLFDAGILPAVPREAADAVSELLVGDCARSTAAFNCCCTPLNNVTRSMVYQIEQNHVNSPLLLVTWQPRKQW